MVLFFYFLILLWLILFSIFIIFYFFLEWINDCVTYNYVFSENLNKWIYFDTNNISMIQIEKNMYSYWNTNYDLFFYFFNYNFLILFIVCMILILALLYFLVKDIFFYSEWLHFRRSCFNVFITISILILFNSYYVRDFLIPQYTLNSISFDVLFFFYLYFYSFFLHLVLPFIYYLRLRRSIFYCICIFSLFFVYLYWVLLVLFFFELSSLYKYSKVLL